MMDINKLKIFIKKNNLEFFEGEILDLFYSKKNNNTALKLFFIFLIKLIIGFFISIFKSSSNNSILYNSNFSFHRSLEKEFSLIRFPWILKNNYNGFDLNIFIAFYKISYQLKFGINHINSNKFKKTYINFYNLVFEKVKKINSPALILQSDTTFFQKTLIDIYKKLKKPSFIYLHGGLPASYEPYRFNLSDYLLVWGDIHKEQYIKNGFRESKILVTGNYNYQNCNKKKLRFDFDNILILSKSALGSQKNDGKIRLQDSFNSIKYLNMISSVLKKFNIKNVRLRLHPSEDINWYKKNIETSFFEIDRMSLKDSLNKSSLVIGPKSTVFVETIYYGINYLFFEPINNNYDLNGLELTYPLIPESGIPYATNKSELRNILKNKIGVDSKVINLFLKQKFDISGVVSIIKNNSDC